MLAASFQDYIQSHFLQEAFLACLLGPPGQPNRIPSFAKGFYLLGVAWLEMTKQPARKWLVMLEFVKAFRKSIRFLWLDEAWRHADGENTLMLLADNLKRHF